MSNVLKVTTPSLGYENSVKNNPLTTNDKQIQHPIDPSKVVRADGRTDTGQNQDLQLLLNRQSNFGSFIQNLNGVPQMTELFTTLLFQRMGSLVESGIGPDFAQEVSKFLEMIKMSEGDLVRFLKGQADTSVRYKGAFFTLLRQVMGETKSVELKANVLDFLKRYNDMSSGPHLLQNINMDLKEIAKRMYPAYREVLDQMMQRLDLQSLPGNIKENAGLLKEEIIPFLSQYITKTHDMGKIRSFISLLTFNTARYENGDQDRLMQSLQKLTAFPLFKQRFNGITQENLLAILQNTDFEKASKNDGGWAERFIDILRMGVSGAAGMENKQVFSNLMSAILMNESVYMPLVHLMLPVELNGHMIFSEFWIDPDDDSGTASGDSRKQAKLLIKFDIQNLGFFDMVLWYGQDKLDLKLFYPDSLSVKEGEIRAGLMNIVRNNGLEVQSLSLHNAAEPITLSEVFPKIFERNNLVNVTI